MGPPSRAAAAIAIAAAALLIAFAGGYGYHRDELYFIAAGEHLDWAYADQGPLTPLIARATTELASDSLTALRIPSALAAATTILLTALIARELGGRQRAQAIAAGVAASSVLVLFTGHLLSTSTFDLLAWAAVTYLAVRAVRREQPWLWPLAGVVLGLGLLNKPLPAFLAAGLLVGVAIAGPRRLLLDPRVWAGAAIALAVWAPWIVWQADRGWPQLDVSRAIAEGESASSEAWWAVIPFQVLLVGPLLAPVWIAGLFRLFRDPAIRDVRFLAWAWLMLAVVFMLSGGKPYYLAGLLPALIAAGALSADEWLSRGRRGLRAGLLGTGFALSALLAVVISLPVLSEDDADPVLEVNEDVGETIGWPELARTIAAVQSAQPGGEEAVVFTGNYGEAGALQRFGPPLGVTRVYSGHNAFGAWGPPPDDAAPVILVGIGSTEAKRNFEGCRTVARVENDAGADNEEDGGPVLACRRTRGSWSEVWPRLIHLG